MVMNKKANGKMSEKGKKRNLQKETNIIEGALKVFGEKGFEDTTISAISKAAKISEPTLYEYFSSKEEVLFAIPNLYTRRELERIADVAHFIHNPAEKIRAIIQAYLEFYENNRLYTSVALLTLKGNRKFLNSPAYAVIKGSTRHIVEAFNEGVKAGIFREDIDAYLVRNMVLGFIEHLTIQWLLVGRPQRISSHRDEIFDMVFRAIEKRPEKESLEVKITGRDLKIEKVS
jgi:TetR/AcrR family transcriptional regulator, fatty acid metabolism regulator protein